MSETRFFIDGKIVSRAYAVGYWYGSSTYRMANKKTRDSIFRIATNGDENGNHNPNGEVEHLAEAGILLK